MLETTCAIKGKETYPDKINLKSIYEVLSSTSKYSSFFI
jgi:hypothetical protein